jgi:hypothetical protein
MSALTDRYDAIVMLAALRGVAGEGDEMWNYARDVDGLVLHSSDIASKWGFNDGDCPDSVMSMVETYIGQYHYVPNTVWHPVLWGLVHEYLLPVLDEAVPDMFMMPGIHNPVRTHATLPDTFVHGQVTVPWLDVLARVVVASPDIDD